MKILSSEYGTFHRVKEYIIEQILPRYSVIYDPMAGTAPLIPFIETNGYLAYFNDILPIHFYINRAKRYRIFKCYKKYGYEWFFKELLHCMDSLKDKRLCLSEKWIEDSVMNGFIKAWHEAKNYNRDVSTLIKALILLCVRPLSSITMSENPTWIKNGGLSSNKDLRVIIGESLSRFNEYYRYYYEKSCISQMGKCILTNRDAAKFRLPQKVDLILTSPPYCNRLDTIRQYGPENYFLSAIGHNIHSNNMIGTNKVIDYNTFTKDFEYLTSNSKYANILLNKIKKSPKKDDQTYYLKYYTRYFAMVSKAFEKVIDNLSYKGKMYIVLQDNIHRGELIEIDKMLRDLLRIHGWQSRVIKKWERHHLGLRNISREHAFVKKKHFEKIMVIWR